LARHIPGPLYFEQQGASGTPMLFLHSTPDDHRLWMFQTAHFSAWYRCIAVDFAGYGRSPAPQPGVRIVDQADACWEVVDRITAGGIVIQGNSMGSMVARVMAAQRPERTLVLIISGCAYQPERSQMKEWGERFRQEGLALRREQILYHFAPAYRDLPFMQWYADMLCGLDNIATVESIVAMNDALQVTHPAEFGEGITSTALLISGSADRNHPNAAELARRVKGCEYRVIEGAGHSSMLEAPAEFDRYCIEFLKKHGLFPG
jgi:pimeloyl-ACP methyl ester carboxylesterase